MPVKKKQKWDRQISLGEGPKAYALFCEWLSLAEDRSCPAVAEKTGRKLNTVKMLCNKFKWVPRGKEYFLHLHNLEQKAIENKVKSESVIWIEREYLHRHESYDFAKKLQAKAQQMLDSPLYVETVAAFTEVTLEGGQKVQIPTTTIIKPVRWSFKDMKAIAELSDQMTRLSLGVPTSRMAVEVSPAQTLEERVVQAQSAMKFYIDNKLERAVMLIHEKNPEKDPDEIRQEILNNLHLWCAEDYRIPDPQLLTTSIPEPQPLGLTLDDEPQELGEGNN